MLNPRFNYISVLEIKDSWLQQGNSSSPMFTAGLLLNVVIVPNLGLPLWACWWWLLVTLPALPWGAVNEPALSQPACLTVTCLRLLGWAGEPEVVVWNLCSLPLAQKFPSSSFGFLSQGDLCFNGATLSCPLAVLQQIARNKDAKTWKITFLTPYPALHFSTLSWWQPYCWLDDKIAVGEQQSI